MDRLRKNERVKMNTYCHVCLHQIEVALQKTIEMMNYLEDRDLLLKPTNEKLSVGELLVHIAAICKTDYYISIGYTKQQMDVLYSECNITTLADIKKEIKNNFSLLQTKYSQYSEEELFEEIISYWGTNYSRFEWLVEIVAHIYHHRGQLHAILTHVYKKELNVLMFE